MDLGDFLWWTLALFVFIAYLMIMFQILVDLFRDPSVNGWVKAIWVIALIFLPFITALIYLIVRGRGMAERRMQEAQEMHKAQVEYTKSLMEQAGAPGASSADQIAQAKQLLDSGAITPEEFEHLKQKALQS
jgi:ABC-type multidrug transport system fused ATPase/permease subunit